MMGMGGPGMMLQGQTSKPVSAVTTLARFWRYFRRYGAILIVVAALVSGPAAAAETRERLESGRPGVARPKSVSLPSS